MSDQSLGPYRIARQLGRGGMGVVYAVTHPDMPGRSLALKLLERGFLADEHGAERFRRESEALARVRHPGVVAVHSAGELPQGHYFVTDVVLGESLKQVLAKGGALPGQEVARIGAKLCDALGALHAEGVLHRDLKPENVILQPNRDPVLIDFGVAKDLRAEDLTQTGTLLGTPAYMAPEQANGELTELSDPRVDVYGLGATLFALATGRAPYTAEGAGPYAIVSKVLSGKLEWPAAGTISPDLEAVLRRALQAEQGRRYASASAMAEDLRRVCEGQRVRPRRWPWVAAGACALAALLGAGAFALRPAPAPPRPPLEVVVEWPPSPSRVATVEVQGRVSGIEGASARVACGGAEARVAAPAGRFALRVTLGEGSSRLRVQVRDGERSTGSEERELTLRTWPDWFYALAEERRPPLPLPAGVTCGAEPGDYVSQKDASVLRWIPPGSYVRGGSESGDSQVRQAVRIGRGLFLGKYEVTWEQFWQHSGGAGPPFEGTPQARHPVVNVTWQEAVDYCAWAGGRLPTESEWEYAARGTDGRRYPWGNERPTQTQLNLSGVGDGVEGTAEVGQFKGDVSFFGCMDMAGNVSEWVHDLAWGYPPAQAAPLVDPQGPSAGTDTRLVRGGGLISPRVEYCEVTKRTHRAPGQRMPTVGFRLAIDPR